MGRWATYWIGREGEDPPEAYFKHGGTAPGWAWWELPLDEDHRFDPGPGRGIVAHVLDSDVADVRGLRDGRTVWRWVFGEAMLAGLEGRPVDGMDLEDSLPERAEEAASVIAQWSEESGLPIVDRPRLVDVLQQGFVFAEEGVGAVLDVLRLVTADSTAKPRELSSMARAQNDTALEAGPMAESALPDGEQRIRGGLAAAIDHGSPGWHTLVASHWLHSFGEPPSVVTFEGSVYVAFDPPISLGGYLTSPEQAAQIVGATGGWREVPAEHAGSLLEAAAWARQHVGTQGRPADENRLKLNIELPLEYPNGVVAPGRYPDVSLNEWWRHSIADPQSISIELAMGTDLLEQADLVADWLDHARSALVVPVQEAWAEREWVVHGGDEEPPPYALVVSLSYRTARGRYGSTKADDTGWLRVLKRLRAGELTSVNIGAAVADGHGNLRDIQPWGGLHVGAQLAADRDLYDLPAHLTLTVSEPLRRLFDRPFVDDLVSRAVEALPVVGGFIDMARTISGGDGPSGYELFANVRSDQRRDPHTCVRGPAWRILLGPGHLQLLGGRDALEATGLFDAITTLDGLDGPLLMVQSGQQPEDCTAERRATLVEALTPVLPAYPGR